MKRTVKARRLLRNTMARQGGAICAAAVALAMLAATAQAQTLTIADPNKQGSGTLSTAAAKALAHGPLPFSSADVAAKTEANRAYTRAVRQGVLRPASEEPNPARTPTIVGGRNFSGQTDSSLSPSDSTGAAGPTRYIQLVNAKMAIYGKTSSTPLGTGTLNDLAGLGSSAFSFDPQVIWDQHTGRFYYVMDSVFSDTDNELSIGFSTTAAPNSAADFCHYTINYGSNFPDYPKLGDSSYFLIVGVNTFGSGGTYVGSDLNAMRKPPSGTACPDISTFKFGRRTGLVDDGQAQVFTPIPANEIDEQKTGYVIARSGIMPSKKLWLFPVTKDNSGNPVFGSARSIAVASYNVPPAAAEGGGFTQLIDTSDARNTQAVLAVNPDRAGAVSLWTQHTIASGSGGTLSGVRWYEIDPLAPAVLDSGTVHAASNFIYNGAISPDRRVGAGTAQFGNSFVIGYTESSGLNNINPRFGVVSRVSGGALSRLIVRGAGGPYRDNTCANPGDTCRWGDYSSASPDPAPSGTTEGNVWLTNQFSGTNTSTAQANWRTEICRVAP